jgi:hypothetical protein
MPARFSRRRDGSFEVRLVTEERDAISGVPGLLREVLEGGDVADPALARLFPPAFLDDAEASEAFEELTRDESTKARLEAAATMEETVGSRRLTEDEMNAWLAVMNDVRLILSTRLKLTAESRPEDFQGEASESFLLYRYLTGLTTQAVTALSGISESSLVKDVMRREWRERRSGPRL